MKFKIVSWDILAGHGLLGQSVELNTLLYGIRFS